jgi:hypothetical protein
MAAVAWIGGVSAFARRQALSDCRDRGLDMALRSVVRGKLFIAVAGGL